MLETHLTKTPTPQWVRNAQQKYDEFLAVYNELHRLLELILSIPEVAEEELNLEILTNPEADRTTPAFYRASYETLANNITDDDVEVLNALIAFTPPETAQPPPGAPTQHAPKARRELEPGKLEKGVSPARLDEWIADFWSYMKASHFLAEETAIQHRHLHGFLADNLWITIKPLITVNMPVFPTAPNWTPEMKHPDEQTCIRLLTTTWAANQPVTARRLKLFRHKQADGQAFSDYLAQHADLEIGCDLSTMTAEHMYVMTILAGCIDNALLDELLKINNGQPENRTQISQRTEHVEQRRATATSILQPSSANALTGHQRRKQAEMSPANRPGPNQRNPQRTPQPLPPSIKGKCLTCGSKSHSRKNCPPDIRRTVKCTHCQTSGNHDTDVCINHARKHPPISANTADSTPILPLEYSPNAEPQTLQAIGPDSSTAGLISGTFNPLSYI